MNKLRVEPRWAAAAFFVAYLYMVWVLSNTYPSFAKGDGGYGKMAFAIMALPIGAVTLMVFMVVLLLSFKVIEAPVLRAVILVVALLVFLADYGIPSFYLLLIGAAMTVYGYITEKRRQEDEKPRTAQ